jgi:cytoskeletal protein CcmA (bactofilin family)
MFHKKQAGFREGVDTLVGYNTEFTGNIESEGTVRIDGRVKGDLKVSGDVYVGDKASVTGNVEGSNVHLAGTVEGNIFARGILKISSTAKLYGDIKVNSFIADEGALFEGKCNMTEVIPAGKTLEKGAKRNYKKSAALEDVCEGK